MSVEAEPEKLETEPRKKILAGSPDAPKLRGRPRMPFDQGIADYVCDQLVIPRSLSDICRDDGMPDRGTIMRWVIDYPDFGRDYARSRKLQAQANMDDIVDISDDGRNDWMERQNFDGAEAGWHLNGEAMARSRLRIDTRKWMAAHMEPETYGEHISVDQKTILDISDPLVSMLERIAGNGNRLVRSINVSPNAEVSRAGRNDFASEPENDRDD